MSVCVKDNECFAFGNDNPQAFLPLLRCHWLSGCVMLCLPNRNY